MPQDPIPTYNLLTPVVSLILANVIRIFGFSLSLLGIYGRVLHIRCLLPYYIIPSLSALLNETQRLLEHAEGFGAIGPESVYRTQLEQYEALFILVIALSAHGLTQRR
jgi:hypothetical protein